MKTKTPPPIRIGMAIRGDISGLQLIDHAASFSPLSETELTAYMSDPASLTLVAFGDRRVPLGFVIVQRACRGRWFEIVRLAVKPKHWRSGVGTRLIRYVQEIRDQQLLGVCANVRETELDTQLFFKAMGFRCTNILRGLHANSADTYRFVYRSGAKDNQDTDPEINWRQS